MAAVAAVISVGAWLIHLVFVILGPERRLMAWLYDDCFYYVITARHLSLQGISSFDGLTRTTGYHPLWMWLCAAIVRLHNGLDLTLVRLCMSACALISISLVLTLLAWALRRGKNAWLWTLALACSSYSAWNNGLTIMEWPLVVLFAVALHLLLLRTAGQRRAAAGNMLLSFLLGVLLTLSRTDSGLIPACYAAGGLMLFRRYRNAAVLQGGLAATAGAVAGLGVTFLWNHVTTGAWLQQSAIIKHLFAQVTVPFNSVPALWQFLRVLFFLPRLEMQSTPLLLAVHRAAFPLAAAAVILVAFIAFRYRSIAGWWRQLSMGNQLTFTTGVVGIASYLLLDSFNSGALYGWYTAPVTGFILCLTSLAFARIRQGVAAGIVFPILFLNAAGLAYGGGNAAGQYGEIVVGKYLHAHYPDAVLAGGDVGKSSFYNGGTMLNTDGLMNNEIVPYLVAGRIHCYLLFRHVQYATGIGSIAATLEQRLRERRGDPQLPWDSLISHRNAEFEGEHVDYFIVHPDAIRATGECGPLAAAPQLQPTEPK